MNALKWIFVFNLFLILDGPLAHSGDSNKETLDSYCGKLTQQYPKFSGPNSGLSEEDKRLLLQGTKDGAMGMLSQAEQGIRQKRDCYGENGKSEECIGFKEGLRKSLRNEYEILRACTYLANPRFQRTKFSQPNFARAVVNQKLPFEFYSTKNALTHSGVKFHALQADEDADFMKNITESWSATYLKRMAEKIDEYLKPGKKFDCYHIDGISNEVRQSIRSDYARCAKSIGSENPFLAELSGNPRITDEFIDARMKAYYEKLLTDNGKLSKSISELKTKDFSSFNWMDDDFGIGLLDYVPAIKSTIQAMQDEPSRAKACFTYKALASEKFKRDLQSIASGSALAISCSVGLAVSSKAVAAAVAVPTPVTIGIAGITGLGTAGLCVATGFESYNGYTSGKDDCERGAMGQRTAFTVENGKVIRNQYALHEGDGGAELESSGCYSEFINVVGSPLPLFAKGAKVGAVVAVRGARTLFDGGMILGAAEGKKVFLVLKEVPFGGTEALWHNVNLGEQKKTGEPKPPIFVVPEITKKVIETCADYTNVSVDSSELNPDLKLPDPAQ